ncbi:L-threonylcarbamoyladenylate synthase [Mycoplasmopsis columbinasalis]|uniref:L-threonylcarbamoyladenylate synthase n=1 Tax=Mycoplasmopsis columbinasalis TaxID=114880 RepID=A0A449BAR3_9BACT|nr:Sua5/YciO/YrdC/YwlC family protein [Mycoplasmopsis columbinasalis]VEU78260.1 Putative translation factor (SUA5) [Mycoplasmopsis columbinasalis]
MNKWDSIFICDTDTVCGIGGPVNSQTLTLLYEAKHRPLEKKIMILVGSLAQAQIFPQWNQNATEWAQKHWPGAYSIIVNNQGFRMPNCEKLCQFLIKNGPMYVSSANISGSAPIHLNEAQKTFPFINNVYSFDCTHSDKPSQIFNLDTNEWIR